MQTAQNIAIPTAVADTRGESNLKMFSERLLTIALAQHKHHMRHELLKSTGRADCVAVANDMLISRKPGVSFVWVLHRYVGLTCLHRSACDEFA